MELIDKKLISINSQCKTKESIVEEIVNIMLTNKRAKDKNQLINDLYKREEEASTSMGLGIAMPHAQSSAVVSSAVVFLKLHDDVDWNGDKVSLIFGIFVPEKNPDNIHLKILSQLARKLTNEEFRSNLLAAKSIEECYERLKFVAEN